MEINTSNSMESSMASVATEMLGGRITRDFSVSILKNILDTQEMQAQALIGMMSAPTPTLDGTGRVVNIGA